jgi:sarcosine oxidase gamma subunit
VSCPGFENEEIRALYEQNHAHTHKHTHTRYICVAPRVEKGEEAAAAAAIAAEAPTALSQHAHHTVHTVGPDETMTCSLRDVMALGAGSTQA